MSDTVKIILIVAFFVFFIYKRKLFSFLSDRKEKRLLKKGTEKGGIKKTAVVASALPEDMQNVSLPEKASPCRYEVYAFDYAQYADMGHFADRINAKLDVIEMSLQGKKHYIKFVELGTLLLILVKYHD